MVAIGLHWPRGGWSAGLLASAGHGLSSRRTGAEAPGRGRVIDVGARQPSAGLRPAGPRQSAVAAAPAPLDRPADLRALQAAPRVLTYAPAALRGGAPRLFYASPPPGRHLHLLA